MHFDDIKALLPNGFHDAFLRSSSIDYVGRKAEIEMEVLVGVPESGAFNRLNPAEYERREAYRRGRLSFSGLLLFQIDVPDQEFLEDLNNGLGIDLAPVGYDPLVKQKLPDEPVPVGAFLCSFYFTNGANSFLHIVAYDVEWTWLSEPRTIY